MSTFKNEDKESGNASKKGLIESLPVGYRIILAPFVWLFTWEHTKNENEVKTNSLRIAVISIIFSIIFVPGLVTCAYKPSGTTTVYVQLTTDEWKPTIPSPEHFVPQEPGNIRQYIIIKNKKYFLFQKPEKMETISSMMIHESSCAIIPAGEELRIYTKIKPKHAINMEDAVEYALKRETLTYYRQFMLFLDEQKRGKDLIFIAKQPWKRLAEEHWENILPFDNGYKLLTVQALAKSDTPENTPGGLVCF